jgi:hypothetical protein
MSERSRRRAFLAVAAMLAGAALVIEAIDGAPNARPPKQAPVGSMSAAIADPRPRSSARPRPRARRRRGGGGNPSARRQARRFLRAFLRYQERGADGQVRALLAGSAEARVRDYLTGAPPRGAATAGRPRVAWLRVYRLRRGEVKASALLDYAGERSLFEFLLRRRGRDWRVSELYP